MQQTHSSSTPEAAHPPLLARELGLDADPAEIASAREAIAPFWETWAEDAGPDHVEALAAVRQALGK